MFDSFCFPFEFEQPLDEAIEKKNKGNEYFQQGNFEKAGEFYTLAIELCPKSDKQELPKFYQNRAAAYENLVCLFACYLYMLQMRYFIYVTENTRILCNKL